MQSSFLFPNTNNVYKKLLPPTKIIHDVLILHKLYRKSINHLINESLFK